MIQDPADELAGLVRRAGEAPTDQDRRSAALIRRRFGLALPPPFVAESRGREELPIRDAVPADGPAIAAVKWRAFRVAYRGLMPDPFLDDLQYHPTAAEWYERVAAGPGDRSRVLVAGRPGEVHGFAHVGPLIPGDDPALDACPAGPVGQVYALYLDPTLYRRGVGRRLLHAGLERLSAGGFIDARLWVMAANERARRFYESQGWDADGAAKTRDFGVMVVDEVRYHFTGSLD